MLLLISDIHIWVILKSVFRKQENDNCKINDGGKFWV